MPASGLPAHASLRVRVRRFPCRATPPPFAALLLLCASVLPFAVALQSTAVPSRLIAERLVATPSPCTAWDRRAFPSRTLLCSASPLRCRAGLRRRVILHFKAVARQISAELCLRRAALRFAFALLCSSKQRLRSPYQSIAVACRGFASPWQSRAALSHRLSLRNAAVPSPFDSKPVPAGLFHASAHRFVASPSRCRSLLCSSIAVLSVTALILRSSRLSRASPSPGCATPCSSLPSPT